MTTITVTLMVISMWCAGGGAPDTCRERALSCMVKANWEEKQLAECLKKNAQ